MNYILLHPKVEKRLAELPPGLTIPTLPDVYARLRAVMAAPNCDATKVGLVIEKDPGLALSVLKVVNSAAYGLRDPVHEVSRAVSLLGLSEVTNLVLAATVVRNSALTPGGPTLDFRRFWAHSLGVAVGARLLAKECRRMTSEERQEAFLAGLVHDLGKVLLHQFFPDDFVRAIAVSRTEGIPLVRAEREVFGFTHQEIGAWLVDRWGLSRDLIKAVELHNCPEDLSDQDESYTFVMVVHLADAFARFLSLGSGGDPFIPRICWEGFDVLGIPQKRIEAIWGEIRVGSRELAAGILG